MHWRRLTGALAAALLVVAAFAPSAGAATRQLRVTIRNTTESQILSPPLVALGQRTAIVSLEREASPGVALVAEKGDTSKLTEELSRRRGVRHVMTLPGGIAPGKSRSFVIDVRPGERLSIATMLVQTNDAFTGVSALPLDSVASARIALRSFDAGSERNNELAEYVPGPPFGGQLRDPEDGVITYHPGILGVGDLDPAVWDWEDPVALLTIREI